jgi:hypothetical protein
MRGGCSIVYGSDFPFCILKHFLFDAIEDKDTENYNQKCKTNEAGKRGEIMNSQVSLT